MNTIGFSGNVTKDAVTRYTQNGKEVVSFCIANNEKYGETTVTTYMDCTAWEPVSKYAGLLKKGDFAIVIGKVQKRAYEYNGEKRVAVDIVVKELASRPKEESTGGSFNRFGTPHPDEEIPF